jgi:hypothetical protein
MGSTELAATIATTIYTSTTSSKSAATKTRIASSASCLECAAAITL